MELFQLIYVETLAKYCNFSKAAEKLFITQPALSQQIQKLEQEIGFSLFARNSKNVSLTFAGKEFLEQAQAVTSAYEQLCRKTQALSGNMSDAIIFGSSALSAPHISEGLSAFFDAYPNMKFQYVETWDPDLLELVRKNEIDVALLCLPHNQSGLEGISVWPIRDEYICAVVSRHHSLAGRDSLALEDLLHETGVSAMDIAKGLLDNGIHPPTMYFPLIVHEALMIEPTETESKETLDEACDVFLKLWDLAHSDPQALHDAPKTTPVRRLDEVGAARNPVLRYQGENQ